MKVALDLVGAAFFAMFLLANAIVTVGLTLGWGLAVSGAVGAGSGSIWTIASSTVLMVAAVGAVSFLVSFHFRSVLIFWRFENPHPGSRAFTRIAQDDPRMTSARPKSVDQMHPREEFALWCNLLNKHQRDPIILKARRRFERLSVMSTSSALMVVALPLLLLVLERNAVEFWFCLGLMLCEYLMVSESAADAGIRLVRAVLLMEGESRSTPAVHA